MANNDLINKLNTKLFKKLESSELTPLIFLGKELGLFGDIIGREFEVYSPNNELLYTVKQKGLNLDQINTILEELELLHKLQEQEMKSSRKNR
jgi:hypothetical protein